MTGPGQPRTYNHPVMLKRLQESVRWSGCFLIVNSKYLYP